MKVLLDECITRTAARAVAAFLREHENIEAHFLLDLAGASQGMPDSDWPTRFCTPPEQWIVITADSGRSRPRLLTKGPPLHLVLPMLGITGVFLSGKRFQCAAAEKATNIINTIPQILDACRGCRPGSRYRVRYRNRTVIVEPWV